MMRMALGGLALLAMAGPLAQAQRPAVTAAPPPRSAPLNNLRYEVTFDSATAAARTMKVSLTFDVAGAGPVLLSLPAWTPGSYEIDNFARFISNFSATAGDKPLVWDKLDYDTWRIQPAGARSISVGFDFLANELDNGIAWARPDFGFFNGTNLFLYPEGRDLRFAATVMIRTQPGWLVATGMKPGSSAGSYGAANYHDLVDMPFFVGRMDLDSNRVEGKWIRLATYPSGAMKGQSRTTLWSQMAKLIPAMTRVFQETPWDTYTNLLIFSPEKGGGAALEHQNSHLGIYNPGFMGDPVLASITAHEIFHAWNVKRLRPADLWPYEYFEPQETTWLWVSEGITDYYADLAMVRSGVVDSTEFLGVTGGKMGTVADAPPTALQDASLSTWIAPANGTQYLYYPKGSLAGFMLDIMIRDASDNRSSLDLVMRELYRTTYKRGRGFTATDWWGAVSRAAGGRSFADFNARYVDGREPYPWDRVLALAGMRMVADTIREPRLGVATAQDSTGAVVVEELAPRGVMDEAGVKVGDRLVALGNTPIDSPDFGKAYRERFGRSEGDSLPIRVVRGTDTLTLHGKVRLVARVENRLDFEPNAAEKAVRIRNGIMKGTP
jgi:predicted metalloprotease with PDZ domain